MQKGKVLSKLVPARANLLSHDDLEGLSELLKTDLSLTDAFSIIKTKRNEKVIDKISERLKNGEMIEVIFKDHITSSLKVTFEAFISYLSFEMTLRLILSIEKEEGGFTKKVKKDLTYPILLLTFSVIGIYLFNSYCFEPLLYSMDQFASDLTDLYLFKDVLDVIITVMFVLILCGLILFLYFHKPKRQVLAYILLERYMKDSLIKEYLTSQFVLFFAECYKIGLKTKDSIDILRHLRSKPLVSFIASNVDRGLLEGKGMAGALDNKYLDERIIRFIKIAMYSGEMEGMLESYLVQFRKRFTKYCAKWAKAIQVASYGMIGLVIIFIYQILFIPMGVLGGL